MTKQRFFKSFGGKAVSLTNLCTNGNFASTSGWTNHGMASFGVSGNVASALANSAYDYVDRVDVPMISGHKYYICATFKMASGYTTGQAYMALWDTAQRVSAVPQSANNGSYAFISGIGTAGATQNGSLSIFNDIKTSSWATNYTKYISVIDLTAAFGAGNEPTQAQMDGLMTSGQLANNWVNGTQTVVYNW